MACLGKGRKVALIKLADELELLLGGSETVLRIRNLITSNDEYDEDYVKNIFETILQEKQEHLHREQEELVRKENIECIK